MKLTLLVNYLSSNKKKECCQWNSMLILVGRMYFNFIKLLYARGAFHILLSTFATRFAEFFGTIAVVRLLTKEEYGLVSYVENIYGYLLIFAGLGLSNGLLRYVVLAEGALKEAYFRYVLGHSIVRNCVLALGLLAVNLFAPYPQEFEVARDWVPLMALLLPLQDLVKDGRFGLRALFRNKLYADLSLAVSLLLIIGRIAGAYLDGVGGVLWSRVLINGSFAVLVVYLALAAYRQETGPERCGLTQLQRRELDRYSGQYMLTNGLWALFMLNDTFLLGQLGSSPAVLAEYKVAYVVPGILAIFATAVGMFVGPYFTKHEHERAWVCRNWQRTLLLTAAVTGLAAAVFALLARPLIVAVYGEVYEDIAPLMRWLLLASFIYSGLGYTTVNLLSAMGEVRYNINVSLVGIAVQVVLDCLMIPSMGAYGVAFSSCITYTVMCVLVTRFFMRKYHFRV